RDGSAISRSGQILAGMKAEAGNLPETASCPVMDSRAMSLRRVFDELQAMPCCKIGKALHRRRLSIEMDRKYDPGPFGYGAGDLIFVDQKRFFVGIHQNRRRSDMPDGCDGGMECVCLRDD